LSRLITLYLGTSHVDYGEQFLFFKNIRLLRLLEFTIQYETLAIITNNFANDATRLNCANLKNIDMERLFVRPENFRQCFPLL
jgi:hypothetical protein